MPGLLVSYWPLAYECSHDERVVVQGRRAPAWRSTTPVAGTDARPGGVTMSALSLKVYESGVTCNACVLQIIWKPDAFNEITDEPEQDDDALVDVHRNVRDAFSGARAARRRCRAGIAPNARRRGNTVEIRRRRRTTFWRRRTFAARPPSSPPKEGALHGARLRRPTRPGRDDGFQRFGGQPIAPFPHASSRPRRGTTWTSSAGSS